MFLCDRFNDIKKEFDNNNNSHSYIFYTNDFFSCKKDVYSLIKSIFNCDDISNIKSDFFVVEKKDNKTIVKDDILGLKKIFQNTSYLNKNRIYLIEEAHKLNPTTSNMILKFLEEPLDGVVGLFITDNLDSVISTIKSRCQIVNVFYNKENDIVVNKDLEELDNLLFNSDKYKTIINIKNIYGNKDRNELIELFQNLFYYIYNNLNINNLYKINILNKAIYMLNSNVNIDYVFDYILLDRK